MKNRVRITDVSPRDGLQNEPGIITTADKVRLIELLCTTGVDEIEVTSFVSPKWVPQLGDAAELLRAFSSHPLPEGGGRGVGSSSPPLPEGGGMGVGSSSPPLPEGGGRGVGSSSPPLPEGGGRGVGSLGDQPRRWRPPPKQSLTESRAKALRAAATEPERALWHYLRQREKIGAKIRRQHPFGPYILDFFCQEKLLAFEIDGRSHLTDEELRHDAERDAWAAQHGVRTIRFSQEDVIRNTEGVAKAVREAIRSAPSSGARKPTPQPPPSGRGSQKPLLSALVPNEQGLSGAIDANRAAQTNLLSKVSVFTAASETFSKRNTNATIAETIERFRPVVANAHAEDLDVRAYVSCAIACPFEGPIAPSRVVDVCEMLHDLDVDEIDLGDTIGAGTPESIARLLDEYSKRFPIIDAAVPLTLHLHDTFGRAADCVKAALDLGVRSFDGSVAGLGGCPYASTTLSDGSIQRAPGNISTELLVRTILDAGYETGVDLDKLASAAAFAREIVAKSRAS